MVSRPMNDNGHFFNLTLQDPTRFTNTHLDVRAEVVDLLPTSILQVEVGPAQQQLLGRQFHQVLQGLPVSQ